MLAAGRNYVIERENAEAKRREDTNAIDQEATQQMDENTERILRKFLNGGNVAIELTERESIQDEYSDGLPTAATLSYTAEAVKETSKKVVLTAKHKVLIAVYILVALSLALAITLTTMSLTEASAEFSALVGTRNGVYKDVNAVIDEIKGIENGYDAAKVAAELGFKTPSKENISYYSSPNIRSPQQYTVDSNWFDTICDFLSGLIGG
ncbi:MAG: hypothetical protein RR316_03520 [Clostridia bacterium]